MNLKPSENTQLYGLNVIFDEIIKLYNEKNMPTKILLSGKKGLGKATLAYHIINYILSNTEDCKYDSIKLIDDSGFNDTPTFLPKLLINLIVSDKSFVASG